MPPLGEVGEKLHSTGMNGVRTTQLVGLQRSTQLPKPRVYQFRFLALMFFFMIVDLEVEELKNQRIFFVQFTV